MKDYDAYLFDWDGTLARTLEIWLDVLYEQYQVYGLQKITRVENAHNFGDLRACLRYGLPEEKLEEFIDVTDKEAWVRLPGVLLYDDVKPMLNHLKARNKKLALVTTAWQKTLDLTIGSHGIKELFDVIVVSEHVARHKPDPEGINIVLQKLGVPAGRALMIGDSEKDLAAAKNAGVDSLLFYPSAHEIIYNLDHLLAHDPKYTIRAWKDMIDQLQ
ncbi:MAG TPA: HAD family hydrolase [Candidatus Saccharimonadales bacterium]|jgi:pyrophosphatase PpaX|nr:HAD family hydrolase [Candidatus Saccharimonadales bacterium]